jgi:hypothetical protein
MLKRERSNRQGLEAANDLKRIKMGYSMLDLNKCSPLAKCYIRLTN